MPIFRMPIFRMPVVLHANCPHANSPATDDTIETEQSIWHVTVYVNTLGSAGIL